MTTIIDPAWEISQLISQFFAKQPTDEPTWGVVQNVTGVAGPDLYEMLSIIVQRLERLNAFVETVSDPEFDEIKKRRIAHAIKRFSGMFNTAALSQAWKNTRAQHVNDDDALQISWFSVVAKRYKPLHKLSNDERSELTKKIDEAIKEIGASLDIPSWAREPLESGLRRLRLIITKIDFFGCEAAIDGLLALYHGASDVEEHLRATTSIRTGGWPAVMNVMNVVALAVNILCAADQMTAAFERYRGWELQLIRASPRLAPYQTRLLSAPAPPAPQSNDGEENAIHPEDVFRPRLTGP